MTVENKQPILVLVQQLMLTMQETPAGSSVAAPPSPALQNRHEITDFLLKTQCSMSFVMLGAVDLSCAFGPLACLIACNLAAIPRCMEKQNYLTGCWLEAAQCAALDPHNMQRRHLCPSCQGRHQYKSLLVCRGTQTCNILCYSVITAMQLVLQSSQVT